MQPRRLDVPAVAVVFPIAHGVLAIQGSRHQNPVSHIKSRTVPLQSFPCNFFQSPVAAPTGFHLKPSRQSWWLMRASASKCFMQLESSPNLETLRHGRRDDTLEAESEAEVRAAIASLPIFEAGMLEIVALVPLEPYAGFAN